MRTPLAALSAAAGLALFGLTAGAYSLTGQGWARGSTVTMEMQLSSDSRSLIDGSQSWNQVGESALAAWNGRTNITFDIVRGSNVSVSYGNGANNVSFSSTAPGGGSFGSAIAVTRYRYAVGSGRMSEADVSFDSSRSWNSYQGNLQSASSGGPLLDLYRVAVHEFGHVLGLDHPDEAGQARTAIMNSRISNTDRLQTDDVNGLIAIYGATANRTPSVTASCSPCTVASGNPVTLTASASDPDGDSLSYAWTVTVGGTIGNSGLSSTSWTAPFTLGTYTATVTVTDSRGASASSSVSVTVTAADRLRSGSRLTAGQYIQSPNSRYRLIYQGDGNLVLYDMTTGGALWWTSTGDTPGQAILQTDGNFVVYSAGSTALWFTETAGNLNAFLAVQSDGNVVVYSEVGRPLWHRFL